MKISGHGMSDTGSQREGNEDACFVDDALGLYIVCDGMGGHTGGAIASALAIESVVLYVREHNSELGSVPETPEGKEKLSLFIRDAIQYACGEVFNRAMNDATCRGMGTTLTMLLVRGGVGVLGHVGDSRCYLCRSDELYQLSHDHTLIQEMIERGAMSAEAAESSPYAHVLSRALGIQASVQVDTLCVDILAGDRFLLCSDGLTEVAGEAQELSAFFRDENIDTLPEFLVRIANERNCSDNVTALVVSAVSMREEQDEEDRRSREVHLRFESLQAMYMFRDLDLESLARIVNRSYVVSLKEGDLLFEEGAPGDSLFVLLEGRLEVVRGTRQLAELSGGNHVGEMSLLAGRNRSATVRALKGSRLLQILQKDFESFVYSQPAAGVRLLTALSKELCARLDAANEIALMTR